MSETKTDCATSPETPVKATPSAAPSDVSPGLSPEVLKELNEPHTLKHVPAHTGLTTVFRGRGRGKRDS